MTEPLTRQDVAREVHASLWDADGVAAALLAMAECDGPWHHMTEDNQWHDSERCGLCHGTGLNQDRAARGLKALKGQGT